MRSLGSLKRRESDNKFAIFMLPHITRTFMRCLLTRAASAPEQHELLRQAGAAASARPRTTIAEKHALRHLPCVSTTASGVLRRPRLARNALLRSRFILSFRFSRRVCVSAFASIGSRALVVGAAGASVGAGEASVAASGAIDTVTSSGAVTLEALGAEAASLTGTTTCSSAVIGDPARIRFVIADGSGALLAVIGSSCTTASAGGGSGFAEQQPIER